MSIKNPFLDQEPLLISFLGKNNVLFGIRPIRPEDKSPIKESLKDISKESLRFRFFEYKKEFSEKELKFLTEVDQQTHAALVAICLNDKLKGPEGAGVARYVCSPRNPKIAEVAIIVRDKYQGNTVGEKLLIELIKHAKTQGIKEFIGEADRYNSKMVSFMKKFPNFKMTPTTSTTYMIKGEI